MPKEGNKIRVHDESVNTYGFRVLTSGWMNRKQFEANPIMLYNHAQPWRGDKSEMLPIGFWKDLKVKGGEIHGIPMFDVEDEDFAKTIAGKYERNVLRAASVGIRIMATSDAPEDMAKGQTRPSVTKWELREISIVDVPANKNAVVLYDADNNMVNLSDSGGVLPKIKNQQSNNKMEELKIIAQDLGLNANANVLDIRNAMFEQRKRSTAQAAKINNLEAKVEVFEAKEKEVEIEKAKTLLDAAVKDGRITNTQRPHLATVFADNFDTGKSLLSTMTAKVVKLADFTKKDGSKLAISATHSGKTFGQLYKTEGETLKALKANDLAAYNALGRAEYGDKWEDEIAEA